MDIDQLVEQFARMTIQERNEFAQTLTDKWPHLAIQIGNLIDLYGMVNSHEKEHVYPGTDCQV
jgi:hypothetical protein